jgi:hypothetical protein
MIMQNRKYLFESNGSNEVSKLKTQNIPKLEDKEWNEFFIGGKDGLFSIVATSSGIDKNKLNTGSDNKDDANSSIKCNAVVV